MATLGELAERLEAGEFTEVSPRAYYDRISDSFIFYARDTQSFASRLNSRFTLFLDASDKSLVGFEIKGFSQLVSRIKHFAVTVTNTTVTMRDSVLVAAESEESDDETIHSIGMLLVQTNLADCAINPHTLELTAP